MLTKADKKFLKETFSTKEDLRDLRSQLNDDIDGKLLHQKVEIVKEVGE